MPYSGLKKYYVCGRDIDKSLLEPDKGPVHLVCIMDSKERVVAEVNQNYHRIIEHDHSGISGKHGSGGQSAARFERQRGELVKQWMKQTASIINTRMRTGTITGDLIVAGPAQTKEKMTEFIDTMFKNKIKFESAEYCNLAGIIQMQKQIQNI